jgi:TrmH family RNA methyltransferase
VSAWAHELLVARSDPALAVLEGFHAAKHAARFGAVFERVGCADRDRLRELARTLAPDVAASVVDAAEEVGADALSSLTTFPPASRVVAIARRPPTDVRAVLADPAARPVVLLESPRRLGNVGACVRVAAAAGAAAVFTTGDTDPWHPDALRGAAGLHFALPVARVGDPPPVGDRPLVALTTGGEALAPGVLPPRAVLAFGTERHGLSDALMSRADARVEIPMRAGVSSLNLATAVAVTLYSSSSTTGASRGS